MCGFLTLLKVCRLGGGGILAGVMQCHKAAAGIADTILTLFKVCQLGGGGILAWVMQGSVIKQLLVFLTQSSHCSKYVSSEVGEYWLG